MAKTTELAFEINRLFLILPLKIRTIWNLLKPLYLVT
jgi:hypothetical protein